MAFISSLCSVSKRSLYTEHILLHYTWCKVSSEDPLPVLWAALSENVSLNMCKMSIQIILRMRKVYGPLICIHTCCSIKWFCIRNSEDPDQIERMRRPIWAFSVHICSGDTFLHGPAHISRNVRKRTFGHVRSLKTQISKRTRTVWSEFPLGALWIEKVAVS